MVRFLPNANLQGMNWLQPLGKPVKCPSLVKSIAPNDQFLHADFVSGMALFTHQLTWKCTDCRKTTFLLERAFLHFHVSLWECNISLQTFRLANETRTTASSRISDILSTAFRSGPVTMTKTRVSCTRFTHCH